MELFCSFPHACQCCHCFRSAVMSLFFSPGEEISGPSPTVPLMTSSANALMDLVSDRSSFRMTIFSFPVSSKMSVRASSALSRSLHAMTMRAPEKHNNKKQVSDIIWMCMMIALTCMITSGCFKIWLQWPHFWPKVCYSPFQLQTQSKHVDTHKQLCAGWVLGTHADILQRCLVSFFQISQTVLFFLFCSRL